MADVLYVALQDDDRIVAFGVDAGAAKLVPRAETPAVGAPSVLAVSPDRRALYVGYRGTPGIARCAASSVPRSALSRPNASNAVRLPPGPTPTSRRPPDIRSSTGASSATRIDSSSGSVTMAVPRRILDVCAATFARKTSGPGRPPSSSCKWCWATHAESKPKRSAWTICAAASRYRSAASVYSRRRVKKPRRFGRFAVVIVPFRVREDLLDRPSWTGPPPRITGTVSGICRSPQGLPTGHPRNGAPPPAHRGHICYPSPDLSEANLSKLYSARFGPAQGARKDRVWRVLCRHFFQRYVNVADTVLDLGAGRCEFINHIVCRRRIAFDLNREVRAHAGPGVEALLGASTDLGVIPNEEIDTVFASNFFEHLPTKQALSETLAEVRRVLRPGGRLLILQPNIRYTGGAYWDFFDHHLPLTERSLEEALGLAGLDVVEVRARFLPYTSTGHLPQHPFLVWLYLKVRLAHRLFGQQSWLVAVKPSGC